ncbi:MAG: hypothetical protein K6F52_04235 [Clostridia bacterium]|nr:hypothetical protein [Clostridia bacterium]
MQPYITIETVPISIEYVEKEPVKSQAPRMAKLEITKENNQVNIKSNPIGIKMDSFQPGSTNPVSYTATAGYDAAGRLSMDINFTGIETGADFDAARYSQVSRGIDSMMDTVPTRSASGLPVSNSTIGPGTLKIKFDLSNVSGLTSENVEFQPPDLELKVTERPEVIIKYIGGPLYFPRSADPKFEQAYKQAAASLNVSV